MKIKILCDVKNLKNQGLSESEAERLSGKVVEARDNGMHYEVTSIGRSTGKPWLFNRCEIELVGTTLDLTKPLQERNGCPVEIKYIDESLEYPINGIKTCKNGKRFAASWRIDGTIYSDGSPCENDLVQSPEPLIEGWLNLYDTRPIAQQVGNTIHPTKEEADEFADRDRSACIKVSYRKGEGL